MESEYIIEILDSTSLFLADIKIEILIASNFYIIEIENFLYSNLISIQAAAKRIPWRQGFCRNIHAKSLL